MSITLNKSATRLVERELLPFLRDVRDFSTWTDQAQRAEKLIEQFTPPKPSIKKQQARKKKKLIASGDREAHRLETAAIREEVFRRAGDRCEVSGCGKPATDMDHWENGIGRRREQQAVSNCWALCRAHHIDRTEKRPNVQFWNREFGLHCFVWNYTYRPHIEKSRAALSVGAR